MFATLESIEIMEMAESLSKMIVNSDIADHYRQCLYKMRTDLETQQKISRFVKLKEQYEEVQRFGRYHPDYKTIMKNVRLAKREVDLDENVANFKIAENALQQLLDEISMMIGHSVSESVKVVTGSPFFETMKNAGGCSTGGSCGCSK